MKLTVRSKFNLHGLCGRKFLVIVSLLFMVTLVFSPLFSEVNGWVGVTTDATVETEAELVNAIESAPDNTEYVIGLKNDIWLETPRDDSERTPNFSRSIEIPAGKNITLVSVGGFWTLGGSTYGCVIRVVGFLTIDGIGVTYLPYNGMTYSCVVGIESAGTCILVDGKISNGGRDGNAGGVSNLGTFVMLGGEIFNNGSFGGGGVYNVGTFTMLGGKISDNGAWEGGGVYNKGFFTMSGGEIINNNSGVYHESGTFDRVGGVIKDNEFYDVHYVENESFDGEGLFGGSYWWVYLLSIGFVVSFVFGLLFYLSKSREPSALMNGGLLSLCGDWRFICEIKS